MRLAGEGPLNLKLLSFSAIDWRLHALPISASSTSLLSRKSISNGVFDDTVQ